MRFTCRRNFVQLGEHDTGVGVEDAGNEAVEDFIGSGEFGGHSLHGREVHVHDAEVVAGKRTGPCRVRAEALEVFEDLPSEGSEDVWTGTSQRRTRKIADNCQ